jgi:hypothetical protein
MKWRGSPTNIAWRFEFKRADLWVGAFWKRDELGVLEVWICFVPMVPLHLIVSPLRWT